MKLIFSRIIYLAVPTGYELSRPWSSSWHVAQTCQAGDVPLLFAFMACCRGFLVTTCPIPVCLHCILPWWVRVVSLQLTFKASCSDLLGVSCLADVCFRSSYLSSSSRCAAEACWVWVVSLLLRHVVSHTYRIRVVPFLFAFIRYCPGLPGTSCFTVLAFMVWCRSLLGTVHSGYVQSLVYFI